MKTNIFIVTVFVCIFQLSCRKTRQTENPSDLTHTKKFNSDVATAWFNLLATTTRSKPYVPPQSIRIFSYAGLALYESVVKGMPSYQSIYHHLTGDTSEADKNKEYYWPACANAALARITTNIFQTYSTPNLVPVNTFELMIVVNVAFFFSMVLSSPVTAGMATFGFYMLARLMGQLLSILHHTPHPITTQDYIMNALGHLVSVISVIFPRLDLLAQTSWLIYGGGRFSDWIFIVAQGVAFLSLASVATLIDLRRRQF